MLPKVTEEAVIENIKKRYMNDIIYTNIGPVLISVNPYKFIPITDETWIERYKGRFRHELDPHIYALAEETYRAMKGEKENQCVIIRLINFYSTEHNMTVCQLCMQNENNTN